MSQAVQSPIESPRISKRTLEDLSWDRLLMRLSALCQTDIGRNLAMATPIHVDRDTIAQELRRVEELRNFFSGNHGLPFAGIENVGDILGRAVIGGVLSGEELLSVASTLRSADHLQKTFDAHSELLVENSFFQKELPDLSPLIRQIFNTFEPSGRIRDTATPDLNDLRSRHNVLLAQVRKRMEKYVASHELDLALQDHYYTLRDNRYVLPIRASEKPHVGGIIHGSSNTGATVYVEPEELIESNNKLLLLHEGIRREEHRILRNRTERVMKEAEAIRQTERLIARLDHLAARGHLADEMNAHGARLSTQGHVSLKNARNPALVLKGSKVVPNDITLGDPWQFLIVTGPNTGGKTVTLVTLGLCTVMTQAGMLIPADENSEVALFPRIFCLFGDPQSVEQDLSTFSGHLKRIESVLAEAGPGALILMDEPIVGTEPDGGSALAIAVLERLADRGAFGAVTTHYERLKTLSVRDPRFQNASVGVQSETMAPTFQLSLGVAGSSSPIEMAERLGMNPEIIARAHNVLGEQKQDLHEALKCVKEERQQLAVERAALEEAREIAEQEADALRQEREALEEEADELARNACADTLNFVETAKEEVKQIIKRLQSSGDAREVDRGRRRIEEQAARIKKSAPPKKQAPSPALPDGLRRAELHELKSGQRVYLEEMGEYGVLRETPDSARRIEVSVGKLRFRTKLGQLAISMEDEKPPQKPKRKTHTPTARTDEEREGSLPPRTALYTVDLRGMRVEDGIEALDKAFDKAVLSEAPALYVIHGHGTGAMKKAIRSSLDQSPYVDTWRSGNRAEGGDGCTVVFMTP